MSQNDEIQAFEAAVASQWADMAEVVGNVLDASRQDAEDWLQDALLGAWKGLKKGPRQEPVEKWRAYIITAAVNRGYEVLEKRAKRREVLWGDIAPDPEMPFDPLGEPDPLMDEEDPGGQPPGWNRVDRAIEKLPPKEREIVRLRFREPYAILAGRLGLKVKSAQEMFSRAVGRLRVFLKEAA